MDIIDQMFPPVPEDGTVMGQYLDGQKPWQILQSIHNSSAAEAAEFYRDKEFEIPKKVIIETKVKK